jgi:NAD(P)-dependent dehydrogenase (short-subunit alcohol dehydrogenase family)
MPDIPADWRPAAGCFAEKIILVTGAGEDIGAAVARRCADHGATVILLDRDVRKLEEIYDDIVRRDGPEPAAVPMDFAAADVANVDIVAETIEKEFGRLDGIAFCSQILGTLTPVEQYKAATWGAVMQANLNAPFLLTQALLPLLRHASAASVVFTTADVARAPRAYWGAYSASLAAVENLATTLGQELESNTRIRVHTLDPGAIRTRLRAQAYPAEDRSQLRSVVDAAISWLYLLGPDGYRQPSSAWSATGR